MSDNFIDRLTRRLSQPLPGANAQNKMRAQRASGEAIYFRHQGPPKEGGVALLLFQDQGSWFFPLIKRKQYPGIHSGQISLPGGKIEQQDHSLIETAIRESREELGLDVTSQQVIGNLSELYIIASHFNILPVVAVLSAVPIIQADEREVDQVFMASLDHLLQKETRKEKELLVRGFDIRAPYFEVNNQVVWGATAMILNEFITLVEEINHEF